MCSHPFPLVLLIGGLVVSPVCARADDLLEQVERISRLEEAGHLEKAVQETSRLIDLLKRSSPQGPLIPEALGRRASLEHDLGRWREAEHDYIRAIALSEAVAPRGSMSLALKLNNLASLYSATGQFRKAEDLFRRSLALRVRLRGPESPEVALLLSNLAVDLFRQGKYTESADLCRRALDIWAKGPPESDRSDLPLNTLALIELTQQHFSSALSLALAAYKKYEASQSPTKAQLAAHQHTIAVARQANGQLGEAQQTFASARQLLESTEHVPPVEEYCLFTDYARLLVILDRKKEAKQLLRRADRASGRLQTTDAQRYTVDINAFLPEAPK